MFNKAVKWWRKKSVKLIQIFDLMFTDFNISISNTKEIVHRERVSLQA